ncbi:ribulose-phosphate 3-epimerase [Mycobacterium tuberculosis]|nr:ribulose-phosphate 3-epimerase [Mycobacterium tuberculosis]
MLDERGLGHVEIEIDGGVNKDTGRQCIEAGATVLVAGNAVFNQPDRAQAIAAIRG